MIGFSVQGALVSYDVTKTLLSLAVAVAVVAMGVFLVGYRGGSAMNLSMAGLVTGFGVAAMHYLGMAAIHTNGGLHYDTRMVALSVLIAVAAATAALWAAVAIHGLWSSLGASLVMGVAVTGMHYTGMTAVSVHLTGGSASAQSSTALLSFLLVMLAAPFAVLVIAAAIVMFDPDMMLSDDSDRAAPAPYGGGSTDVSPQQPTQPPRPYTTW
jgi:NO-binding membrane sensor protein with MHYT domain